MKRTIETVELPSISQSNNRIVPMREKSLRAAATYLLFVLSVLTADVRAFVVVTPAATVGKGIIAANPQQQHRRNDKEGFLHNYHHNMATTTAAETNNSIDDEPAWMEQISTDECNALLDTAEKAARAAGDIILSNLGCCSSPSSGGSAEECDIKFSIKDVVTQYDKEAQQVIETIVRTQYPNHSFLGEENVEPGGAASEQALLDALTSTPSGFIWICDPIDGTANFASGLPLCGVTITVLYKGLPIVGVIYDPHRNEMFSAIRGQGATLNRDEQIKVQGAISETKDAIVNAGCPADPNAFEVSMRGMMAMNSRARGVRVIACSALTLAWIASGRLTAHFGYDLSSWDLVAGALLIQEAGGRITDIDGSPYKVETRNMLCSNGQVHDEILQILKDADATSFTRSV